MCFAYIFVKFAEGGGGIVTTRLLGSMALFPIQEVLVYLVICKYGGLGFEDLHNAGEGKVRKRLVKGCGNQSFSLYLINGVVSPQSRNVWKLNSYLDFLIFLFNFFG